MTVEAASQSIAPALGCIVKTSGMRLGDAAAPFLQTLQLGRVGPFTILLAYRRKVRRFSRQKVESDACADPGASRNQQVALRAARPADAAGARSRLTALTRATCSMPPNHGAAIVRTILGHAELGDLWRAELDGMWIRIAGLRAELVEALRASTGTGRFDGIGTHWGTFSLLGISVEEARRLRREHGIYLVHDGRMNVAGLARDQVAWRATAVAAVTGCTA